MTIKLYVKNTNSYLGTMTEEDLRVLVDELEEEDDADQDYYFDADVLDLIGAKGASSALVSMLRDAIGGDEGIEVRWERT